MAETPTPLSLSRSSLLSRLTLNSLGSFSLSKPKLHSSTANHHDQRWWSKAPSFWSVCLEIWVWVWISKVGFLLGMAKSQRCLCFDLGFVSSVYFQGLGFEDISKWVDWAVWPCVYVLCSCMAALEIYNWWNCLPLKKKKKKKEREIYNWL